MSVRYCLWLQTAQWIFIWTHSPESRNGSVCSSADAYRSNYNISPRYLLSNRAGQQRSEVMINLLNIIVYPDILNVYAGVMTGIITKIPQKAHIVATERLKDPSSCSMSKVSVGQSCSAARVRHYTWYANILMLSTDSLLGCQQLISTSCHLYMRSLGILLWTSPIVQKWMVLTHVYSFNEVHLKPLLSG
jgi:hypothetical protein